MRVLYNSLLLTCIMFSVVSPCCGARVKLLFHLDGCAGGGVVLNQDKAATEKIIDAVKPLRQYYDVYLMLDPMIKDKKKLDTILQVLAAKKQPFIFSVYASDGHMLGSVTLYNAPVDPIHGVSASIKQLTDYRKRYGKLFAGLRIHEVFAQDFTVEAMKTTNPEWRTPGLELPKDAFFQPHIAEKFVKFAHDNAMFVQWTDWHWHEFAGWDKLQVKREEELTTILKKYPGVVTVTYANNEPDSASVPRLSYWQRAVKKFRDVGAAGYGLSNQSWMRDDITCPIDEMVAWTQSALDLKCSLIQFEPVWYYFNLPRGTFAEYYYSSDPSKNRFGEPRDQFVRMKSALIADAVKKQAARHMLK